VAGSLTYGDAFAVEGIRLGVKPDGTNRFKGTLDEFRIHHRALSDSELTGNVDFGAPAFRQRVVTSLVVEGQRWSSTTNRSVTRTASSWHR
jgi:hypothetical protein